MKVQFDGLWDVKEFMLMIDIYEWCDKQKEWGGKGFNIQNWYIDPDDKEKIVIEESVQSKVLKYCGGCRVITPYYKQLSWLFSVLFDLTNKGYLDPGIFLNGFRICCEEYFKRTPEHSAKELMLYILENIQRMNDEKSENDEEE